MALSNMLNEPRREITETLVGAVVVLVPLAAFLYLDYQFGSWFASVAWGERMPPPQATVFVGMLLGLMLSVALAVLAVFVHAAGDSVCGALDKRGVRLRPARRP